jgi:hypothetical protein
MVTNVTFDPTKTGWHVADVLQGRQTRNVLFPRGHPGLGNRRIVEPIVHARLAD